MDPREFIEASLWTVEEEYNPFHTLKCAFCGLANPNVERVPVADELSTHFDKLPMSSEELEFIENTEPEVGMCLRHHQAYLELVDDL